MYASLANLNRMRDFNRFTTVCLTCLSKVIFFLLLPCLMLEVKSFPSLFILYPQHLTVLQAIAAFQKPNLTF